VREVLLVHLVEALARGGEPVGIEAASGQRHGQLVSLSAIAQVERKRCVVATLRVTAALG
jgi:hypothetical protein